MCTMAKDTTNCRGRWSQEYLRIANIPSCSIEEDYIVRLFVHLLIGRRIGRRVPVRDETESVRNLLPRLPIPNIPGEVESTTCLLPLASQCIDGR